MKKINKKTISFILATLLLCFITMPSTKCFAKTNKEIQIGDEISNKISSSSYDGQYYKISVDNKMKLRFSVTVEANTTSDDISFNAEDEYYDEEDEKACISLSLDDGTFEYYIDDWTINEGETKTTTVTLYEGNYQISIYGGSLYRTKDLKYSLSIEDISNYTNKITMQSELNIMKESSKKLKVKSEESGKLLGKISWSTSNKNIATVDSNGTITGVKAGTCTISAKSKNSNTVKCEVIVKNRPQLYITEAGFNINYVGGIEPYITIQNNFGKTIKYIYFKTYYYNRVGDPAYCEIQKTNYKGLKITGPIKNKVIDTYYWDAVIYNNSTGKIYIKSAEVIFMDGTKKTISIKKSYK